MFKKIESTSFFYEDKKIIKFWEDNNILKKTLSSGKEIFSLYDGPPTANGKPHIGHIVSRIFKDIVARYKYMMGYQVFKKIGWDTHGLPVELEVEKELKLNNKHDIESFGTENFVEKCKESVFKYKKDWENITKKIGFFIDIDNFYMTCSNDYIESVWWAIKKIYEQNILYKDHTVLPYCSGCETSLSAHEVAQNYKNIKENSVFVKFKIKNADNDFFLVWTTTPWTIPCNVVLALNPEKKYSKIKWEDEHYILSFDSLKNMPNDFKIMETFEGYQLEGKKYEPIFPYTKDYYGIHYVICDDFVDPNNGTGIVHIAPAFGEDDARIGRKNHLPVVNFVNLQGKFTKEVTDFYGCFVKNADKKIIENLKKRNLLFKTMYFEHSYPFCWRCDTPLIYYSMSSWFIKVKNKRNKMLEINESINWIPENLKKGRFGKFLEKVVDWNLTRTRYWGTPIPIWECECGEKHCIGSIEELKNLGNFSHDVELHRPFVDKITIKCPKCKCEMKRVPEVLDCWFDSGCMPFAQFHYPFENKELFEKCFPSDFISEAIDQTRGWFYSLFTISSLLFNENCYKNALVLGHVLDKNEVKMSKHKGNVTEPEDIIDSHGADAVRWYFFSNNFPWISSCYNEKYIIKVKRKFLGTIWNTYNFFILYANIDEFSPENNWKFDSCNLLDKWIISKINSLVKKVTFLMDDYKIYDATKEIEIFVDELSNWYIRRSRERFWSAGMPKDKKCAYMTLYKVLVILVKLCAPFIPFITEEIYQNLVLGINKDAKESVHLCSFPVFDKNLEFNEIEKHMDAAKKIVMLGRTLRCETNIKNRQPLKTVYIKSPVLLNEEYKKIILEELNVKEINIIENLEEFAEYKIKPELRVLGPKFGKNLKEIFGEINKMQTYEIVKKFENGENFSFNYNEQIIEISKKDVLLELHKKDEMLFLKTLEEFAVIIDTNLTEELIEEGYVREIISKIQNLRKTLGFEVQDYINIKFKTSKNLYRIIEKNINEIKKQTLCTNLKNMFGTEEPMHEVAINDEELFLNLIKNCEQT